MTEKHKAALAAGRKRAALKRSTSAPRMQHGKGPLKPGKYSATATKVETDAAGRIHATFRVRGIGLGPGGKQVQLHEPPPDLMGNMIAAPGEQLRVDNVLAPPRVGRIFESTIIDDPIKSPVVSLTNRINDAMLDVARDRKRWLERKRAFDLLDTRDENYLNAMSRVGLAFISYIHAAQEFKRLTSINAEA